MIKLYVSVLAVLACITSFAQPSTTFTAFVNPGTWSTASNWTTNGTTASNKTPGNGDVAIIPTGVVMTVSNANVRNLKLQVHGTLNVTGTLSLTGTTWNIEVFGSGVIQGGGTISAETAAGVSSIFNNTTVTGPKTASYSSPSFQPFIPLPVKFTGFSVARQNSDVLVQWSTSEEVNAENYYVERSFDGANWATIATVASQGNTSSLTHYFHLDKHVTAAIAYYRIRQVDLDGQYTYTAIRSVKSAGGALAVNVAAINNRVVLQFSAAVKGSVEVRLVSLAGQVVSKQIINNPVGQVVLNNSALKGSYIVTISNAADINVAKQVVL